MTTIFFDLDGTLADLYGVDNWLAMLRAEDATPYATARPLCDFKKLARLLNQLQRNGYRIGIITWLSKDSSPYYKEVVRNAKKRWLMRHLTSVLWNEIHMVQYGTPKQRYCRTENDILFDDDERNLESWRGVAYSPDKIIEVLSALV